MSKRGGDRTGSGKAAETTGIQKLVHDRLEAYIMQQLIEKPHVTIDGLVDSFMEREPLVAAELTDRMARQQLLEWLDELLPDSSTEAASTS